MMPKTPQRRAPVVFPAASVVDAVLSAAREVPDEVWLVDLDEPSTGLTFTQLAEAVAGVAFEFARRGIQRGDTVAISLRNRPEFLFAWFATNWLGAAIVPMNMALKERETGYILEHSDARRWVIDDERHFEDLAARVARELEGIDIIPVADIVLASQSGHEVAPAVLTPDDLAGIIYTSGTTGQPKGCLCPHSYYTTTAKRFAERVLATPEDRFSTALPLFHMNAQTMSTMGSLVGRTSLVLEDRFHATGYFERLARTRATVFNYIGAIPSMLWAQPSSSAEGSHDVRVAYGGGIDPSLHRAAEERFGVPFIEGYGMTEVGMVMGTPLSGDRKVGTGCCGEVFEGVEARLVSSDGTSAADEGQGELYLRGHGFFSGYHKRDRSEAFDPEGWFKTGDVLRRDEDDDHYFVDRSSHVIRRSGENISAREVESVIAEHDAVSEVAVIGVPDDVRGEEVKAYVIPVAQAEATDATRDAIIEHVRSQLADFKIPRYLEFADSLPRTPTERIQKNELKERESRRRPDG